MDARYPFTQEGERDLIRRAKRDDLDARNRLMSAFFEAARAGCRHHGKLKGLDPDDAESEAYFALEEAIYGFDLRRRGVRFSTYLGQRCRGAATLAAREQKKQSLSDPQGWRFKEKPPPNSKANGAIVGPIGPVRQYWPPPAI